MSELSDEDALDPVVEALEADDGGFISLYDADFGSGVICERDIRIKGKSGAMRGDTHNGRRQDLHRRLS